MRDVNYTLELGAIKVAVDWGNATGNGANLTSAQIRASGVLDLAAAVADAAGVWYNLTKDKECFDIEGEGEGVGKGRGRGKGSGVGVKEATAVPSTTAAPLSTASAAVEPLTPALHVAGASQDRLGRRAERGAATCPTCPPCDDCPPCPVSFCGA